MENNKKFVKIGEIVKTNGLKGACVAVFYIENENSLEKYQNFYNQSQKIFKFSIKSKMSNNQKSDIATKSFRFLIEIENVLNLDDAMKLVGQSIFVDLSEDDEKSDDEFYINDLIGMDIFFNKSGKIQESVAKIFAIHDFGAGPIVEIKPNKEFKKFFGPNQMFLFNEELFYDLDLKNKKIFLKMPEFCS